MSCNISIMQHAKVFVCFLNILYFRLSVLRDIRMRMSNGDLTSDFFIGDGFDGPEDYLRKMSHQGEYIDEVFLSCAAMHLRHDIIVIPVHASSAPNGQFHYYSGNCTTNCPIFLGKICFYLILCFLFY